MWSKPRSRISQSKQYIDEWRALLFTYVNKTRTRECETAQWRSTKRVLERKAFHSRANVDTSSKWILFSNWILSSIRWEKRQLIWCCEKHFFMTFNCDCTLTENQTSFFDGKESTHQRKLCVCISCCVWKSFWVKKKSICIWIEIEIHEKCKHWHRIRQIFIADLTFASQWCHCIVIQLDLIKAVK